MFCPNCGAQNADTSKFCLKCGAALPVNLKPAVAPQAQPAPVAAATSLTANSRTTRWIIVGIIALVVLMVIALVASQTGPFKPSKPGVYLQAGRTELRRERTMSPQQQGLPQTGEKRPKLLVYLPGEDTQYLQFMSISNGKRDLGYDTLAYENGIYTLQPVSNLAPGAYCIVLGGPFMAPMDVSWWCFNVTP